MAALALVKGAGRVSNRGEMVGELRRLRWHEAVYDAISDQYLAK
jgi:hypothetical protein